jgi:hypothetical protein
MTWREEHLWNVHAPFQSRSILTPITLFYDFLVFIVHYLSLKVKEIKIHNVSETDYVSVFREEVTFSLGPDG